MLGDFLKRETQMSTWAEHLNELGLLDNAVEESDTGTQDLAGQMRQAIQTAQTTDDLKRLHDDLTAAWGEKQVDRDTAESLTRLMWEKDRQLYQAEIKPRQVEHAA